MKKSVALLTGLTLLLLPGAAWAEDFPAKPIRLIVPFPAGGPNDIIARVIGQRMSEIARQPVVIDNRGGQGGVLGTDAVAKAAPDGYTIAITTAGALAISPGMEKVAYDTLKDLAPVTLVATVPEMLVTATGVPAKNMAELVALAKAQPGNSISPPPAPAACRTSPASSSSWRPASTSYMCLTGARRRP